MHHKRPTALGIYATNDWQTEPCRVNVPEEDWLLALCAKGTRACKIVQKIREEADGADDDCPLLRDIDGLLFNLEMLKPALSGQLVSLDDDKAAALNAEIDRRTRLVPAINRPEEDQLLRILGLIVTACDAVDDAHDAADAKGECHCDLCGDVWGLKYNAESSLSLIGCQLDTIDPSILNILGITVPVPAEPEADAPTAIVAY